MIPCDFNPMSLIPFHALHPYHLIFQSLIHFSWFHPTLPKSEFTNHHHHQFPTKSFSLSSESRNSIHFEWERAKRSCCCNSSNLLSQSVFPTFFIQQLVSWGEKIFHPNNTQPLLIFQILTTLNSKVSQTWREISFLPSFLHESWQLSTPIDFQWKEIVRCWWWKYFHSTARWIWTKTGKS